MTTATVCSDALEVSFSFAEKLGGLLRDVRIPLDAVRAVEVVPDGVPVTRGIRAPGFGLPGVRSIGTWRRLGGKSLVSVRRGRPALRVELAGQRWDELLLTVPEPDRVAADLAAARR